MILQEEILEKIICCPDCKNSLIQANVDNLICKYCNKTFSIKEGIYVLMELSSGGEEQAGEQKMREQVAEKHIGASVESIMSLVSKHHCVPVMSEHAKRFRAAFNENEWIADIGCGMGWCWRNTNGGNLLLIDFAFSNLKVAQLLLKDEPGVILIQANAARLPIKDNVISGAWSVQVTQHFSSKILDDFLSELKRALRKNFLLKLYNLNPAPIKKLIYKMRGRYLHLKGEWNGIILNIFDASELRMMTRGFSQGYPIRIGYSELFFHPDLHLEVKSNHLKYIENIFSKIPGLARFFARQIQIEIGSRKT